jgi:hypothetical protein
MPTAVVTPWGHHLPDPELSRAAAERDTTRRAMHRYRRFNRRQQRRLQRSSDSLQNPLPILPSSAGSTN